jgi:hypothetical protein
MLHRRRWSWAALALAVLLIVPGCLGPNHSVMHLSKWNRSFESDWAQEGVFLVCFPAYIVCAVGDMLIFNSIQWWSGENPISRPDAPGDARL